MISTKNRVILAIAIRYADAGHWLTAEEAEEIEQLAQRCQENMVVAALLDQWFALRGVAVA